MHPHEVLDPRLRHEAPAVLAPRRRVLLVDDEPPILAALRRTLRGEPYDLLSTPSPQEALEWLTEGEISLVVSDQRMPEMEGTELLRETRRRSPDTIRVILTGYPEPSLGGHPEVQRLLQKPWDDGRLRRTIRDLLAEQESRRTT